MKMVATVVKTSDMIFFKEEECGCARQPKGELKVIGLGILLGSGSKTRGR